uniref:Glycosyltransferase n=1 Tax=Crocosmia x crocosmiiflora TaxID=1053288 RepID=A0A5B8EQW5_CROXC|nr:myricetin 3-O-(6'-O-caffeoyl)-glucosyl 1,2-rhamnoside 1,2-glucosyltransferase [Crocosmia x crocosmiiflora]
MSSKEGQPFHMLFFPFMAPGHFQPVLYMAERFAAHGVRVSILTTPANVPLVRPSLDRANIELHTVPFPSAEAGLPKGCENYMHVPSPDLLMNFYTAMPMLRDPFAKVFRDLLPDCVVTDGFFYWSYAIAAELNIPRLVFNGTCLFSTCVAESLDRHKTLDSLPPAAETVVIPGLPHRIEMLRSQLPPSGGEKPGIFKLVMEADAKSYGIVVNTFSELESDYLKCFGRKAWPLGPLVPRYRDNANDKAHDCVKWLDRKSPGSTVYVCFGSTGSFTRAQMRELALGLESSDQQFVWVVAKDVYELIPQGFEERVGGKGLIIRGWAPQVLILNHPSVGGFLTHCGWNSCLEGVSAGLPLATWPMHVEQFFNERLIVDVLRIGVSVGVKKLAFKPEDNELMEAEMVKKAVDELMGSGEAADLRRQRARELGEKARKAVEEGGSSYVNMANLIQELIEMKNCNSRTQAI